MKILKARNGIALVAVLTIMLITSLFIPVMFSMSDSSLAIAVKGTDRQRSSYLARTITEMSVAAFKAFHSTDPTEISGTELTQYNNINTAFNALVAGTNSEFQTSTVAMFSHTVSEGGEIYYKVINATGEKIEISKKEHRDLAIALEEMEAASVEADYYLVGPIEGAKEEIVYAEVKTSSEEDPEDDTTYENYLNGGDYIYIGEGKCTITYDGSIKYYKTSTTDNKTTEITADIYNSLRANLMDPESTDSKNYTVSTVENRNVIFTSTATVNGSVSSRTCILVLPTYPSEEEWFTFGIAATPNTGGNQIFVDPSKATSVVPIEYDQAIAGKNGDGYVKQNLLVYSSVGNMKIQPTSYKDSSGKTHNSGEKNSQFVLGIQPGLNTTPNNDPSYAIIDGVNYDDQEDISQMNNFIAFASTSAIQVDMPVNLLVNPCRAKRIGDGYYIFGSPNPNGSLFKVMIFQAPIVQFNERLDMMMSFYVRDDEEARRMSSIILSAPDGTPYSYYNSDRQKTVKAGKVFFQEDCYLWIIPYGEDGSASAWTGFMAETVYYRDSDFTKIKIASAGDVYYFNAEVMGKDDQNNDQKVGLSLTGYYLETEYIPKYDSYNSGQWWQVWNNTKAAIFDSYMNAQFAENPTYVKDDFKYIGNINKGDLIEVPEGNEYYTIWAN